MVTAISGIVVNVCPGPLLKLYNNPFYGACIINIGAFIDSLLVVSESFPGSGEQLPGFTGQE